MQIDAKQVKALREKTGAGFMDCKKALVASDGDVEKAQEFLQKKGLERMKKRENRTAAQGVIGHAVAEDSTAIALVELNCETDFVSRSDEFASFAQEVTALALKASPADLPALMETELSPGKTVSGALGDLASKIGEKLQVGRYTLVKAENGGLLGHYIHTGSQIAVVVEFGAEGEISGTEELLNLGRDLSMHICAANPEFLDPESIDQEVLQKKREIFMAQVKEMNKPEKILDKIVSGKIKKWTSEVCFTEQAFVKDPDMTIRTLVTKMAAQGNKGLQVKRFVRLAVGQA